MACLFLNKYYDTINILNIKTLYKDEKKGVIFVSHQKALKEGDFALYYPKDVKYDDGLKIGSLVRISDINAMLGLYCVAEPGRKSIVLQKDDSDLIPVDILKWDRFISELEFNSDDMCIQMKNGMQFYFFDRHKKTYRVTRNSELINWDDRFPDCRPMNPKLMLELAAFELDMMLNQTGKMPEIIVETIVEDFLARTSVYNCCYCYGHNLKEYLNKELDGVKFEYGIECPDGNSELLFLELRTLGIKEICSHACIHAEFKGNAVDFDFIDSKTLIYGIMELFMSENFKCCPSKIFMPSVPDEDTFCWSNLLLRNKKEKEAIIEKLFQRYMEISGSYPDLWTCSLDKMIKLLILELDHNLVYANTFKVLADNEIRILIRDGILPVKMENISDYRLGLINLRDFIRRDIKESVRREDLLYHYH